VKDGGVGSERHAGAAALNRAQRGSRNTGALCHKSGSEASPQARQAQVFAKGTKNPGK
jgi:hypothetical protein